jgi:hypothetical protein
VREWDWVTIAGIATAVGTLVLALATFGATRSANRAARVAELALLEGLRPLLVTSRLQDSPEKVLFGDGKWLVVEGGRAAVEAADGAIYFLVGVRNVGQGIAVLHGWHMSVDTFGTRRPHADPAEFRTQTRDLYVPAGDTGYWQGALRDPEADIFSDVGRAIREQKPITIDVMYGDQEGGQRTISRFTVIPREDEQHNLHWYASVSRHWNLDRPEPRAREDD